jgi:YbbR domain-containing protein
MIRQNITYKLLALAIALITWTYVNVFQPAGEGQGRNNPYLSDSFIVPLKAKKVESNFTVAEMPEQVTVMVEGRKEDIAMIAQDKENILAYVNVHGWSEGSHNLPVIVKLPEEFPGVTKRSEPRTVNVVLEAKAHRQMGIETQVIGLLPESFRFAIPYISPANATVFGTAKKIAEVSRLVIPVNATSLTDNGLDGTFRITPLDVDGKALK